MAESVKRRVAAARLAVAFVAAGTIAGATAWAQPGPPAVTSAEPKHLAKGEHIKKATLTVRHSDQVVDGSLLFEDFKKGEVPPFKVFQKVEISLKKHKNDTTKSFSSIKGEIGDIKSQIDGIKGELGSFIKGESADARYIKITDDVVRGDGSVFTASAIVDIKLTRLLDVPGMFTVDASGPTVKITNTSTGNMSYSACGGAGEGTMQPGGTMTCDAFGIPRTLQLVGAGAEPQVSTLTFTGFQAAGGTQVTVQILIGL